MGADPEVFVKSRETGAIVSSIGLIGGTKANPRPAGKGFLQEDNVLAEFNIQPCITRDSFVENVTQQMRALDLVLRESGNTIHLASSHTFELEYLKRQGMKALKFGCNPSFNAYTGEENPSPSGELSGFRTASGHLHLGIHAYTGDHRMAFELVKSMDIHLGLPSVALDDDRERRKLYGQAGACRLKEYGVEYMTLSNFWLSSQALKEWVYIQSVKAAGLVEDVPKLHTIIPAVEIQRIINEYDVKAAMEACVKLGVTS
jgi:hypothetical protein